MLAAGVDPKAVMAELTGRAAGVSKGKGGSMHMFAPENDFYGGHGIVGAQVSASAPASRSPTATASNGKVAFVYFGDGAANQGQVYESFNMAELWRLPVVYVIENNQYAMGTSDRALVVGDPPVSARRQLQHPRRARSTAWTCWPCATRAPRRPSTPAPARAPSSWR